MDHVTLGRSSLKVSRLCFGMMGMGAKSWRDWVLEREEALPLLDAACAAGFNFFDTCDFYSAGASEEILGEFMASRGNRNQIVVATKLGNPMEKGPNGRGYSRKHVVEAVEASLRRLKTDRIDLCQTHIWDSSTNIEEMVEAFDLLVRQGKVLYLGATDIPCWQLAKAVYHARHGRLAGFASLQLHYNAIWREDERDLLPFAAQEGLGLMPYSPMGRGFLTGPHWAARETLRSRSDDYAWKLYGRDSDHRVAAAIGSIAAARSVRPAQIALAFVLARLPSASPVVGLRNAGQLDEALQALDIHLAPEEIAAIEAAYEPRPSGGHF